MQTLIVQIATTFADDAAALVNGFGRIVTHIVMAPIDRIANASDVAGILPERRTITPNNTNPVWRNVSHESRRGRRGGLRCLRFLSELT